MYLRSVFYYPAAMKTLLDETSGETLPMEWRLRRQVLIKQHGRDSERRVAQTADHDREIELARREFAAVL